EQVFEDDVVSLAINPLETEYAIGFVTGHVECYEYDQADPSKPHKLLWETKRHKQGCRALAYCPDGKSLVSAGSEGALKRADAKTGRVVQKFPTAHSASINALCFVSERMYCTGDDDGCIRSWDCTAESGSEPIRNYATTHEDYISSLEGLDGKFVLATSGDGTLSVHDLRSNKEKAIKRSEDQEDDLTCCTMTKQSSKKPKLIVGTASGVIEIFNKGDYGDCNDRILPPAEASSKGKRGGRNKADDEIGVECLARIDEEHVLVGGSDGKIRVLQVLPNKYLRVLGDFGEEHQEPVEAVVIQEEWVFAISGPKLRIFSLEAEHVEEMEPAKDASSGDEFSTSDESDGNDKGSSGSEDGS
ncbi:WD40-repeat-containing domain protein, partial [Protomyces lactucae-debilis]